MRRTFALISAAALFIGLLPIFSVLIAGTTASLAGCDLDEGGIHPCVIMGVDYGETLYTMAVLGWLGLISLPIAALGALGLFILGAITLIARLRR